MLIATLWHIERVIGQPSALRPGQGILPLHSVLDSEQSTNSLHGVQDRAYTPCTDFFPMVKTCTENGVEENETKKEDRRARPKVIGALGR